MKSERQSSNQLTCLTCHRSIDRSGSRLQHCPACGSSHHALDYEVYWTRSPRLELFSTKVTWVAALFVAIALPSSYFLSMNDLEAVSFIPILLALLAILAAFSAHRLPKKVAMPSAVLWIPVLSFVSFHLMKNAASIQESNYAKLFYPSLLGLALAWFLVMLALVWGRRWRAYQLNRQVDLDELKVLMEKRAALVQGRRHYCLACFETMPTSAGVCASCDFHNFNADRRVYWNRNPKIESLESLGKFLAVGLGLLIALLSVLALPHWGMGSGWFIAMSLVVSYALALTCSKLTRHLVSFQPSLFWCLVVVLLAATTFPLFLFQDRSLGLQALATLGCFALATVPLLLGRAFARWKRGLQDGEVEVKSHVKIRNSTS